MIIIDRYIGKQVITMIAIVTCALLGVDLFFYLVNELRFIGNGNYDLKSALVFILLTIPRKVYILFPWAALLGTLLALGHLGKNSELAAMRVAAISVQRIAWAAIKAAIILTTFMFICGEVISPITEHWAQKKKTLALSSGQAIKTQFGTWVRHDNEFINVGSILSDGRLHHVTRYNFDNKLTLKAVTYAKSATKLGDHWHLENLKSTEFTEDATHTSRLNEEQVPELLDIKILQASGVKHLERLSIRNLWRVIQKRIDNDLNSIDYERAFWVKVVQPFAVLIMVYLAVPFAFGPLRSASVGLKILVGVLVGFVFHTLNSVLGPLTAVIDLSPMLAAIVPILIFGSVGYFMMQRVR